MLQTRIRVQQVLHQLAADTARQTRILNFFHTNNYQNVVFDGISKATRALVPLER